MGVYKHLLYVITIMKIEVIYLLKFGNNSMCSGPIVDCIDLQDCNNGHEIN